MAQLLHEYYYRKGKVVAKAVAYTIVSALLVALGVFCFKRWDLSFMFTDWKGYMMLGVYGLVTLGMILSAVDAFRKTAKANRGIPAFGVGPDRFVVYDKDGLSTTILFEDCERVRFKSEFRYRGAPPSLTLIIVYHDKSDPQTSERVEIPLNELDCSLREIDRQLKKVYQKYKKEHESQAPV